MLGDFTDAATILFSTFGVHPCDVEFPDPGVRGSGGRGAEGWKDVGRGRLCVALDVLIQSDVSRASPG